MIIVMVTAKPSFLGIIQRASPGEPVGTRPIGLAAGSPRVRLPLAELWA